MTAFWVVVLLAAVAFAYYGMWRGWRNRARRQADMAEPTWLDLDIKVVDAAEGTYLSTTTAGNWLDRITAHGLGAPNKASLVLLDDGDLGVIRTSAKGFRIPAAQLRGIRLERGFAGKVREPNGIAVITWLLGQREVDTGFRPAQHSDAAYVEELIEQLMEDTAHG